MKVLFAFLLLGLLVCCGDATNDATPSDATLDSTEDVSATAHSKISTVKINNLEVMTEDLGKMNWLKAKQACVDLGDGWRLPTIDELNILYINKDKIGGFSRNFYWSSKEDYYDSSWGQNLFFGLQYYNDKSYNAEVRSVRSF